ncbi:MULTISPECIES: type 1 glutamine amidotransferase family protein [Staphylococcus]|uniref:Glutamine amidotransferase n=1 Tax=Staphylococcus agnetis TaxID=985762 RepID=A0A2T4MFX8_9STAP|nr:MULTISPECIES: type 1 glutamine amidotransferase family protein [Staphylococcus]MDG4942875.1 glutamine amidotransferase [Staphylococcus agnetis]NHM92314.1 glutamine amidotransferase [Staphylococcus sp. 10602379]NJI01639.1 glutamine amidotransferase [Staphylococcus agnetis]NJI13221.1 glutamine amidotransferase [Staphylococcus agnetis]PTH16348.1 glutamine amidotransferase [Staphylococcus agnetis]
MKKALFLILDQYADWEMAHLSTILNQHDKWCTKTISLTNNVKSIGGLSVNVDYNIKNYNDDFDLLILVGGNTWNTNNQALLTFIQKAFKKNIVIGAICGAVDYLAKNGLLNDYKHTGNALSLWNDFDKYTGSHYFIAKQVVRDRNLVTANGTASVEFLEHVLKTISFDSNENIHQKIFMINHGFYKYCDIYGDPFDKM